MDVSWGVTGCMLVSGVIGCMLVGGEIGCGFQLVVWMLVGDVTGCMWVV